MERQVYLKMITTCALLLVIDRVEFAYYPFEGLDRSIPFLCCHEPIKISWWVYLISIQLQHFLWALILWMWMPMKRYFKWVVIAFGLCVIEFPLTYGEPVSQLPLPWQWYFPLSCSMLRLASIVYFIMVCVKEMLHGDTD